MPCCIQQTHQPAAESTAKPRPHDTMPLPCHVWFLLPWAEMHVNTLSRHGFPECVPLMVLNSCLNWWSSWRKSIQTFWPELPRTFSPLAACSLKPCFPTSLTHICTNTLAEHRYTIEWKFVGTVCVCFNGQEEAPNLNRWQAPAGCGLMKKLLSEAIRALIAAASPWPSEGFWSVGKQHQDSLHPGTHPRSYCFPLVWPKHPSSPVSTAEHG